MAQKRILPSKAFEINARWTADHPVSGWRHYRISSRRQTQQTPTSKTEVEVEMMAVCDRQIRFWLTRRAVIADENWQTGWLDGAS